MNSSSVSVSDPSTTKSSASDGSEYSTASRSQKPSSKRNQDDDSSAEESTKAHSGKSRRTRRNDRKQHSLAENDNRPQEKVSRESVKQTLKEDSQKDKLVGLSEREFRTYAKAIKMPDTICEDLLAHVGKLVKDIITLSKDEEASIEAKQQAEKGYESLPKRASACRQAGTVGLSSWTGYLTSFFLAKTLAIFSSIPTCSREGNWIYSSAGLLNALVSERIGQGFRNAGAAYLSPDGAAYADCHTASLWIPKTLPNSKEGKAYRELRANTVQGLLKRENAKGIKRLGSGIKEIKFDQNYQPIEAKTLEGKHVAPQAAMEKVIQWAKIRAFITDELPFHWFTVAYAATGSYAPYLKATLMPLDCLKTAMYDRLKYAGAELGMSFVGGSAASLATGYSQNALRSQIQGADIAVFSHELKRALRATAEEKLQIYERKHGKLLWLKGVLEEQERSLKNQKNEDDNVAAGLEENKRYLQEVNDAIKQNEKLRSKHKKKVEQARTIGTHTNQSVKASLSAYMGELSANPTKTLPSRAAAARAWAKLGAAAVTIIPTIAYSAYAVAAVVNHLAPRPPEASLANFTNSTDGLATSLSVESNFMAAAGFVLIAPWTLRGQWVAQKLESLIVSCFRAEVSDPESVSVDQESNGRDSGPEVPEDEPLGSSSKKDKRSANLKLAVVDGAEQEGDSGDDGDDASVLT